MKKIIKMAYENSMAFALVVLNICLIRVIYGSNLLYFWQFFYINLFLYISMKFYEKYRTSTDSNDIENTDKKMPYKFLQKKYRLEILFICTSVITMAVSFIFVDLKFLI